MTKKIMVYLLGAMVALSLAACTPTTEKQAETAQTMPVASTGGASDKVPDPNVEPVAIISVYADNEDKTGLVKSMDDVPELTGQALIDKLIQYGQLPEGTKVLSFEMPDSAGLLDLSALPEMDEKQKTLTLTAIGNTFIENFELDNLKLKIAGTDYEDLDFNREFKALNK